MEKFELLQGEAPTADTALFKVCGPVDMFSYKELMSCLDEWGAASFKPMLMLDMSQASYVVSSGWSVFFLQATVQESRGGALVLFGMSGRVERSLNTIMPRKRHVNVAPDLASAGNLLEILRNAASSAPA